MKTTGSVLALVTAAALSSCASPTHPDTTDVNARLPAELPADLPAEQSSSEHIAETLRSDVVESLMRQGRDDLAEELRDAEIRIDDRGGKPVIHLGDWRFYDEVGQWWQYQSTYVPQELKSSPGLVVEKPLPQVLLFQVLVLERVAGKWDVPVISEWSLQRM